MSSLTTPPRAIFRQIQANLSDRYGDGITVVKELIQNAEDAEAEVIRFVAHPGWSNAKNPLLRVPGFLVANDGRFESKDARGILSFADTAKGDEVTAIGRFGFGQKAVFHLCDSFIAHSLGHAIRFSEVVNPCLGVIENTKAASWDNIDSDDLGLLEKATGDIKRGFVLWLPLRCEAVLPAPKLFFADYRPTGAALLDNLTQHEADLRLILAGMRHLDRIEAFEVSTLRLALRRSQDSRRLLGPPRVDREPLFHGRRAFVGMIEGHAARSTRYAGREAYDVTERLKRLKQADDWPQVPVFTAEGELMQPEKAAEHGAVVVVENRDAGARGVSFDWGVFLPIAEAARLAVDMSALRIMLHGYFFVDSGRRYIEGFSSDPPALVNITTRTIYQRWNETLRDDLVLPLLPGVLHDALQQQMLTSIQLAEVTTALRRSLFGSEHRAAIAARNVLARMVKPGAGGVAIWELLSFDSQLRPLPAPDARGQVGVVELIPELCGWAERHGLTLIADQEAALTKADVNWEPSEIADLLAGLAPEVFLQGGRTTVLAAFVDVAVGGDRARQVAAAKPLLAALRRALAATRALAPGESIGAVLARLPAEFAIALPPSAGERAVLGALASATGAPLCLRREWLAEGAARQSLSPAEAAPLIRSLQSLLRDERTADAAGTAAAALAKLLGHSLDDAARDPQYAQLPVLRAADGSGVARLVTLPDLVRASRDGRLFRDNPRVREIVRLMAKGTPNLGVVIVTGDTAELLADIGAPFAFAEAKNEAFAQLIGCAQEFGPAEARAKLLDRIYTDSFNARSALRALAVGDSGAGGAQARLFTLPQTGGLLDDLALRLIEGSADDFLVPTVVAQELKPAIQSHLGVSAMDGDRLGHLLVAHAAALASMNLRDAEINALLTSDIPDDDLRTLPIFTATDGRRCQAAEVHRETANWKVPPALVQSVPILKLPPSGRKAAERIEKLVAAWSPAAQIRAALDQPEPHRLWAEIFQALDRTQEMPDDHLRARLHKQRWLPDRQLGAWAPEDVFDLPDDILDAARQVLAQGVDLPFLPLAELAPKLRESAAFETLRSAGFLSAGSASIAMLLELVKEASPVAFMSDPADAPVEALVALSRQGSDLGLLGWPLLAVLLRREANGRDAPPSALARILDAFGSVAHGDVERAIRHMQALAGLAETGTEAARHVFASAFRTVCSWPSTALRQVMSGIRVPTLDGNWRLAREVAAGVNGIAAAHRLAEKLEAFWPAHSSDERVCDVTLDRGNASDPAVQRRTLVHLERDCATSLKEVLSRAQSDVPPELLALLVGIVRQTDGFRSLVSKELALPEAVKDRIWSRIQNEIESAFTPQIPGQSLYNIRQKTLLKFELVQPRHVDVRSLAGERVQLPVGALEPLLIIGDGHRPRRTIHLDGRDHWLRTVTVVDVPQTVEAEHIRRMIRTLALECLGYQPKCIEILDELAGECTRVEQTTVEDARARLEDRLPHILDELKPARGTALRRALDEYNRSEGGIPPGNERKKLLPDLKRKLWTAVQPPESASQLLSAIRGKIEQFGYNPDRVLFELFQNADDAAAQYPPPDEARFRLEASDGSLRVLHWGRPVNHPGADAELGQREGWHHDLFNMLLMNLSDKREGVTGRFGLGFKSVHLLSADVGIASGFIACRVRGGMLPDVWDAGRQLSLDFIQDGRRATVIDIPVEPGCESRAEKAVTALLRAARWLPAMSRRLRKIELAGAEQRVWTVGFVETETPGISVVVLGGAEPGRGLALDLGDETTLFVALSADGPMPAEAGLPRLWLLAPLAESVASGWLINCGRFRVDPGRGSLARDENEPQATFERIGAALGARLCELHDLVDRNWAVFAGLAGLVDTSPETGPATFWRRLADLFALDFGDPIARHLHGPDRGFGRLVGYCSVLPTGLPQPFRLFLRARDARYVATGALEDQAILSDLHDWTAFNDIADSTVSSGAASRLSDLGFAAPTALTLAALLKRELGADNLIKPERAGRIGRILNRERVNRLPWREHQEVLDAISKARFGMADGFSGEARLPPRAAADASDEEKLIMAFAPDGATADPGYAGPALALYRLARERSGFQQTAATFAAWASSMSEPEKQAAMLNYVQKGAQGPALGDALAQMRPTWLPTRSEELRSNPLAARIAPDDLPTLLGRLYPEEQRQRWSVDFEHENGDQEEPRSSDGRVDPTTFLERLHDWWEREASVERARSDRDTYPEDFHPRLLAEQSDDDCRVGWFTFFALGIFRTIGRSQDSQHRNFIAAAGRAGWWGEMASAQLPDSPEPWVRRLEDFAGAEAWRIDFPQWRRALVDLYVVARWLPDYIDVVWTLPAIVRKQGPVALSDVWRPSASPLWQRRGLEGAPLTQSLGLGANWLVREAVRHGIWTGEDAAAMHPYGWASTARVRDLFAKNLGIDLGQEANMDLSLKIHALVEAHIGDHACFLGDLDLPLQIVADKRRDDVRRPLLHGPTPFDFDPNTSTDDDED